MSGAQPKMRQVTLTPEKLAELRKDPTNVFMEETHDKVERLLPADEVHDTLKVIYDLSRTRHYNRPEESDADVRRWLEGVSPKAKSFAKTHPHFYATGTAKETEDIDMNEMLELVSLRAKQVAGTMTRQEAMLRVIEIEAGRKKRAEAAQAAATAEQPEGDAED